MQPLDAEECLNSQKREKQKKDTKSPSSVQRFMMIPAVHQLQFRILYDANIFVTSSVRLLDLTVK